VTRKEVPGNWIEHLKTNDGGEEYEGLEANGATGKEVPRRK